MVQVVSIIFGLSFLGSTLYVVRRRKLGFGYAVLWISLGLVITFLALEFRFWNYVVHKLGVYYAPAFIFLVALLFILIYMFRLTITVTKLETDNTRLVQEIAMIKGHIYDLRVDRPRVKKDI